MRRVPHPRCGVAAEPQTVGLRRGDGRDILRVVTGSTHGFEESERDSLSPGTRLNRSGNMWTCPACRAVIADTVNDCWRCALGESAPSRVTDTDLPPVHRTSFGTAWCRGWLVL